jgi:hypothetical protein
MNNNTLPVLVSPKPGFRHGYSTNQSHSAGDFSAGLFKYLVILLIFSTRLQAQQLPDTTYHFDFHQTAYQKGNGPVILIDEAHNNFHTRSGGFFAFSRLLEEDGYQVKSLDKTITETNVLKRCKILVIANSLHASNNDNWNLPTPSAFSKDEIGLIKTWVENGGCLFLIADHMPFAGAAYELGKAFGFEFINGFARTSNNTWPPSVFTTGNGTLNESPVTMGLRDNEKISSVTTFTGSAFKIPESAMGILRFVDGNYSLQPDTAWVFKPDTPRQDLAGFYQGAISPFGKGKIAVFGEAAMFTAQIANGTLKAGFNSEFATQNAQFLLNLIHWLDGVKEYTGKD